MSVRRYATVVYGYSLPCDFEVVEVPEETVGGIDFYIDDMYGEYFIVGKTFVNFAMDDETDDNGAGFPVVLLSPSMTTRVEVKKALTALFPNYTGLLGMWYITRYL